MPDDPQPQPPRHLPDPWAHRRGEPRVFALLWTTYLLAVLTVGMLWGATGAGAGAPASDAYRYAARNMLVAVAAGFAIVWPMVRLSQARPSRSPLQWALADLVVVAIPVQIVLWPMILLAGWPFDTVAALAAVFGAWCVLVGGLLALAVPAERGRPGAAGHRAAAVSATARSAWMLACLLLALAAPAIAALLHAGGSPLPPGVLAWSPLTAIHAVAGATLTTPMHTPGPSPYRAAGAAAGLGGILWIIAGLAHRAGRGIPRRGRGGTST